MDVLTLNDTTYLPEEIVEGYSSMIWTERYSGAGEFELRTPNIQKTRSLLPEGKLITLRDSLEVMVVESHSIAVNENDVQELLVRGRTFETFLEDRVIVPFSYGVEWRAYAVYTPSDIAALFLWNHFVNGTGVDPLRPYTPIDPYTKVMNVVVTESTTYPEEERIWWFTGGQVYPLFLDFLELGGLGVRNIRPQNTTASVVEFNIIPSATYGEAFRTLTPNIQQLRLDIYKGLDRTIEQGMNEPVVFYDNAGHLQSSEYLFSSKGIKTLAAVSTSIGPMLIRPNGEIVETASDLTGLNRRVLYIDGGSKEEDQTEEDFRSLVVQKATIELQKHNRVVLFNGNISPVSPYKYGREYFLGDRVTLSADYGLSSTMVVSEYVRTEDEEGDQGYPTLILPDVEEGVV